MMGRTKARKAAEEKGYSWGDLALMIDTASHRGGTSRVNPQFTLERTCEIYSSAVVERDPTEVPSPWRYDIYKEREVHSADYLIIVNILRDCG